MNKHRLLSKSGVLFLHLLMIYILFVTGCGGAYPTSAPAVVETIEVSSTIIVETPFSPQESEVTLNFWYPGPSDSRDGIRIATQIGEFKDKYPNITVNLMFLPYSDYENYLRTSTAAGTPPDVAKFDYNQLFGFEQSLLPLQQYGNIDQDFLKDALISAMSNENYIGLPLRRDSCALAYDYLSMFSASQHPKEAFYLIDFLTQADQQYQTYKDIGWYPTRISVYDSLGLKCPLEEAIRPPTFTIQPTIELVQNRSAVLENVLDGGTIIASGAVAVFEKEATVAAAAPVWNPLTLDEAKDKLNNSGLVVGALFINEVEEYPSGDYAVKCWTDHCVLVSPDGSEHPYNLLIREEFEMPVEIPRATIVPGSKLTCHTWLIWFYCTRVG